MEMKSTQSNDFESQKKSFDEFIKLQDSQKTDENKRLAKLGFEQMMKEFDKKHGYNPENDKPMDADEYARRIEDARLFRENEEREFEMSVENKFEGRQFNINEFNKIFNKHQKKDKLRKTKEGALTKYDTGDISAFNDFEDNTGGVSIDKYDTLYSDGKFEDFNDKYAGIGAGLIGKDKNNNDDSDDDISIESPDEDEYDNHRKGVSKESLDEALKREMEERNNQNKTFEQLPQNEFKSAFEDKYGISSQLGFMVGTDMNGDQKNWKRKLKEETLKAYKQLSEN